MIMRGDTLIEVLIALAIAVVVISAITTLSISSLNNAQYVASQDQASKYAEEGMEIVRKIRNRNYAQYASYGGTYCLAKGATTLGSVANSCTVNIDNKYIRSVEIEQDGGCGTGLARTVVTVAWTDGKCNTETFCHTSRLSSCLSTISPVQGP